jgi:hypothetical protein
MHEKRIPKFIILQSKVVKKISVADLDPGSGAFLTPDPGSGIDFLDF